jgi:hypothetical protein
MSFHVLLVFRVSVEKSAVILTGFAFICDLSFSLLQFSEFFSLFCMLSVSIMMCLGVSLLVLMVWCSVSFLYLGDSFLRFRSSLLSFY